MPTEPLNERRRRLPVPRSLLGRMLLLTLLAVLFAQALSRRLFSQHSTRRELVGVALVVAGSILIVNG